MKNFTSSAGVATITLCIFALFSLVALADKGPCEWRGESLTIDDAYNGNIVTQTHTYTDKGSACKGTNEDNCNSGIDAEAVKTTVTVTVYVEQSDGSWKKVEGAGSVSVTQGLEVC